MLKMVLLCATTFVAGGVSATIVQMFVPIVPSGQIATALATPPHPVSWYVMPEHAADRKAQIAWCNDNPGLAMGTADCHSAVTANEHMAADDFIAKAFTK